MMGSIQKPPADGLGASVPSSEERAEQFTPGPWLVASDLPSYAVYSQGGRRIVQTPNQNNYRRYGPSEQWLGIESLADACLIAAAPELFAALKSLHARYVMAVGNEGPEAIAARTAIAKAEGK